MPSMKSTPQKRCSSPSPYPSPYASSSSINSDSDDNNNNNTMNTMSLNASVVSANVNAASHSGNASVTYAALIALAIELSEDKRLVLDEIYKFVEKHKVLVPVKSHPNWKNSVRHNLSLRPCFVKVPRYNSSGKAMSAWWTLDTSCLPKAAKEAVERARKFTDGSNQTQTTDQFIREVLTTEDHSCSSADSQHDGLSPNDSVPDAYSNDVTPTPPYTLSSQNAFLFADNGSLSASEEEFAMVPSHAMSPPHLYFPEPVEETQFSDFQMAVYPSDYELKYPINNQSSIFPDITLPSPFSKSSFSFSDLLFAP